MSVGPKIITFFFFYYFKVTYGVHFKKRGLSVSLAASPLKLRSSGLWVAGNQTGRC